MRRLPPGSQYWAAVAGDDERAREWVAARRETDAPPAMQEPSLTAMTESNQILLELVDRVDLLTRQMAGLFGVPLDANPATRPRTAMQKARDHAVMIRHTALVAEVQAAQERWEQQQETTE